MSLVLGRRDAIIHGLLANRLELDFRDITKSIDGVESVYLRRYYVRRDKYPHVYVHLFLRSDDDDWCHDHPWDFTSYIVIGGYTEETIIAEPRAVGTAPRTEFKRYGPGDVLHRPKEWAHRVHLAPGKTSWSLVFAGPREREWGFHTRLGWVQWAEYLAGRTDVVTGVRRPGGSP